MYIDNISTTVKNDRGNPMEVIETIMGIMLMCSSSPNECVSTYYEHDKTLDIQMCNLPNKEQSVLKYGIIDLDSKEHIIINIGSNCTNG